MGRFDVLIEDKNKNKNNKEHINNKDRRTGNSNSNSNNNSNRTYNHVNKSNTRDTTAEKTNKTTINMIENDFPELPSMVAAKQKEQTVDWKGAIKEQEEKEMNENMINQNDPKYWKNGIWVGPMLMRQRSYPADIQMYMDNVTKGKASSVILPYRDIEYSRDDKNWYTSWENTFTEEQLSRIYREEEYKIRQEQADILEEYRLSEYNKSMRFYNETGELDDYAMARLDRMAYEVYAEQFEITEEVYEEDDIEEDIDDYLEDEY